MKPALQNLDAIFNVIRQGPPAAQKKAIQELFERVEVNWEGEITSAALHQPWQLLFITLHALLSTGDIERTQGDLGAHHLANLQATLNLVELS